MSFLSFTVFEDLAMTTVRSVANLYGVDADRAMSGFRRELRREPKVGDVCMACRIDRIGSEELDAAA